MRVRGVAYHVDQHLGSLSTAAYFGRGIEAAMARAGRSAVYWYVSLPAEDVRRETHDPRAVVERATAALDDRFRAVARATEHEDLRFDAAHPMLPYTGQGAAQALEDAMALGLRSGARESCRGAAQIRAKSGRRARGES